MASDGFWESYRDPQWQKKRLEVMNRDGWKCKDCGAADQTLNVHHTYYLKGKLAWQYDNTFLVCLCEACHEKRHEQKLELTMITGIISERRRYDMVTGFALGIWLHELVDTQRTSGRIKVNSFYHAIGLAGAFDIQDPQLIMSALDADGFITWSALTRLGPDYVAREESRRSAEVVEFLEELTFADHDAVPDLSFLDV